VGRKIGAAPSRLGVSARAPPDPLSAGKTANVQGSLAQQKEKIRNMKTPYVKLIPRSPLRRGFLLIAFAAVLLAPSPVIRAQCPQICDENGNTAIGFEASTNTTGFANTATGTEALFLNTTASGNTAYGFGALFNNTIGANNIALGNNAGFNLTTGNNNIDIGNVGLHGDSGYIRIGAGQTKTFIAGISGASGTGNPVVINANGRLGVRPSSQRFKDEIKPMDKASEAILALKPVTFRYKKEIDPDRTTEFGLVAEDVENVNPALVARDADGKAFTVRYEAVNAMLLNEFLKARRQIDAQQKQIEALTAGLQRVSAQLELSKPASQTASNNQ
jgi:hypothetical protein